jgi:hypothetical protein
MSYHFVTEEHKMTVKVSGEFVNEGSAVYGAEEIFWWPQSPRIITMADNTKFERPSTR